jgi:type I restriction enzyme S subunit
MALLQESARWLYEEWFVRLRFPGREHTPIIEGVPQGWEHKALEDVLVLQRGFDLPIQNREEGNIPVYGSTGISGFHSTAKVKQYNGGVSVPTLDRKVVHKLRVIIPPSRLMQLFDDYVRPTFEMQQLLSTQNEKLRAARGLLLSRLMDGEVEV